MPRRTMTATEFNREQMGSYVVGVDMAYEYKVTHSGDNLEARLDIDLVLNRWKDILKKNIHYTNQHSESYAPGESDILTIVFWSIPTRRMNNSTIHSLFDISISEGQGDATLFNDEDRAMGTVLSDDDGIEFGLIVGSTLYINFDLPHVAGEHTQQLLERIMQKYAEEVGALNNEEVAMRKKKEETEAQLRAGKVLSNLLSYGSRSELTSLKYLEGEYATKIERLQSSLQENIRGMVLNAKRIKQLETMDGTETKAARELKSIKRVKGVKRVTTRTDTLRVLTEHVFISTETNTYDIGEFSIEFGPGGELKIFNTTRKVIRRSDNRKLDHPHINGGVPCWGSARDIITLAAQGEIAMATAQILEYLNIYTPGDAWYPIDEWPLVEKPVDENEQREQVQMSPLPENEGLIDLAESLSDEDFELGEDNLSPEVRI